MTLCSKDWKEREKQRRREEILLAAEKCFGRKNYHECTMEDIAKEYGCAVGSIYNFFGSKEEIYREIFATQAATLMEFIENFNPGTDDPLAAVSELILARLEHGMKCQNSIKMFLQNRMHENFANDSMWHESVWPAIKRAREKLESYLKAGKEKGLLRDELPLEILARMIEQNIFLILEEACYNRDLLGLSDEFSLSQRRDFLMAVFFDGIRKK